MKSQVETGWCSEMEHVLPDWPLKPELSTSGFGFFLAALSRRRSGSDLGFRTSDFAIFFFPAMSVFARTRRMYKRNQILSMDNRL
jgi:hypothetical protein